jgi:very-short-patch-repair endonuclease
MRSRAKQLRRSITSNERRIWNWLRDRTFHGFKFRRQVPVGRYVVDFYCPALKLAVEVDGQHHETFWVAEHDDARTEYLKARGIEVVRITNKLLATDSLSAEATIEYAIERLTAR